MSIYCNGPLIPMRFFYKIRSKFFARFMSCQQQQSWLFLCESLFKNAEQSQNYLFLYSMNLNVSKLSTVILNLFKMKIKFTQHNSMHRQEWFNNHLSKTYLFPMLDLRPRCRVVYVFFTHFFRHYSRKTSVTTITNSPSTCGK